MKRGDSLIISLWHGRIISFIPVIIKLCKDVSVVVSTHSDGQLISDITNAYGYTSIRGSSRRDNFNAARGVVTVLKRGYGAVVITPDGPIGPKHKIKGGIVEFSVKYGAPILPIASFCDKAFIMRSWDNMIIPKPFSTIKLKFGELLQFNKSDKDNNKKLNEVMVDQLKENNNL